jgi:leucyl aminopeptidase
MKRCLLGLIVLTGILSSCQDKDSLSIWLHPQLRAHIDVTPNPQSKLLWRQGNQALYLNNDLAWKEAKAILGGTPLVMVRFPFNSLLAIQLAGDQRTLVHNPGSQNEPGFALVDGTEDDFVTHLAAAAHTHHKGWFGCGNLQVLSINSLVQESSKVIPPMFQETVELESVTTLLAAPDQTNIQTTVGILEGMGTRYHTTDTGLEAPQKIEDLAKAAGASIPGITFTQYAHTDALKPTQQKSLIITIPGTDATEKAKTVVIGAHLDSISGDGPTADAPGADDDASGVATIIEIIRSIAATGATFSRSIELHAYAAEEVGLVGSNHIASDYASAGKIVAAMMQFDMNSYSDDPNSKTIHLVTGDTSRTLRRSLKDLMNTYMGGDFSENSLPAGATSDHKSWTNAGYPAVFPFEDPQSYNQALHSDQDTSSTINNFALSERFATLGLAFLAHHAGLDSAKTEYESATLAPPAKDLPVAIIEGDAEGYFHVGVSAPSTVTGIEICMITEAGSQSCVKERLAAPYDSSIGEREIFLSEALALKESNRLAIYGYDVDETLVQQRSIRLDPK